MIKNNHQIVSLHRTWRNAVYNYPLLGGSCMTGQVHLANICKTTLYETDHKVDPFIEIFPEDTYNFFNHTLYGSSLIRRIAHFDDRLSELISSPQLKELWFYEFCFDGRYIATRKIDIHELPNIDNCCYYYIFVNNEAMLTSKNVKSLDCLKGEYFKELIPQYCARLDSSNNEYVPSHYSTPIGWPSEDSIKPDEEIEIMNTKRKLSF